MLATNNIIFSYQILAIGSLSFFLVLLYVALFLELHNRYLAID